MIATAGDSLRPSRATGARKASFPVGTDGVEPAGWATVSPFVWIRAMLGLLSTGEAAPSAGDGWFELEGLRIPGARLDLRAHSRSSDPEMSADR